MCSIRMFIVGVCLAATGAVVYLLGVVNSWRVQELTDNPLVWAIVLIALLAGGLAAYIGLLAGIEKGRKS